ncbi:MAG: PAS domain S-box protein [Desulfobacterales bacterium]|nr:PAS domain S-box protein [Desulfobacterales bacterium]MCP4164209.1 PAS domain S-box protein [Deltaproteobacteria bacterium]
MANKSNIFWKDYNDIYEVNQTEIIENLSKNRFTELADLIPETVFKADQNGKVLYLNQTGSEIFGYQSKEIHKQNITIYDLFTDVKSNFIENKKRSKTQNEKLKNLKCTGINRNKSVFPAILHTNAIFNGGVFLGIIGVVIDLSEQKKDIDALKESEKRYRDIFMNISDYWFHHDLEGRFIETNFAYKNYYDYLERDLKDLQLKDIVPDRYHSMIPKYMKNMVKTGKAEGIIRVKFSEQQEAIYEYRNTLVYDLNGNPTGVRGLARDITKRILAEKALKESEEKYKGVFDNIAIPAIIIENNMIISQVNDKFISFSGYSKDEIEGSTFPRLISNNDIKKMENFHKDRREGKEIPKEYECRVIHENGTKFDVIMRIGMIPNTKKSVASFMDLISYKQIEKIVNQSSKKYSTSKDHSLNKERYRFGDIIGKSPLMQDVYDYILKAVDSNVNVIIYGDSGTGKELVANEIHSRSNRNNFVPVNCGAIPENIIESEFFGYKKGAFTGAGSDKQGFLNYAKGGTLFLDEVGDIDLNMQIKLLRVLDSGCYTPIGSNRALKSDARIITATNKKLTELVKKGEMRKDFFYRIHILPITLPPLKNRKEDLPLLIDFFLKKYSNNSIEFKDLPGHVFEALNNYDWPGNVRELQNTLHRYLTLNKIDFLETGKNLVSNNEIKEININSLKAQNLNDAVKKYEKEYILRVLEQNKWHRGKAADILGINRKTLFVKIKQYGLSHP